MFCNQCGKKLDQDTVFCTCCGAKQTVTSVALEYERVSSKSSDSVPIAVEMNRKPKMPKNKSLLLGAFGLVLGAVLLGSILLVAGVFAQTGEIEGAGFSSPEDAAKGYLMGLRDQDINAIVSSFAVETYVEHYDFEAMVTRLNAYTQSFEIRMPNTSDYTRQMNIESRRNKIVNQILFQYMLFQSPDTFRNGDITSFEDTNVSEFVDDFEHDMEDYVFDDLEVIATLNTQDLPDDPSWDDIEDLIPKDVLDDLPIDLIEGQVENLAQAYASENNQEHIAKNAKIYGADIEDVANVIVLFKADHDIWVFCPEAIRYNGKWYLGTLQGNLASLAGLSIYIGGIVPIG